MVNSRSVQKANLEVIEMQADPNKTDIDEILDDILKVTPAAVIYYTVLDRNVCS